MELRTGKPLEEEQEEEWVVVAAGATPQHVGRTSCV